MEPEFVKEYLDQAQELIQEKKVLEPMFSRGTYQFEVVDLGRKKAYPFIQMQDDGTVTDFFCSCKVSELGKGCPHLAASYLKIYNGNKEPLHLRFRKSLWNRLFKMCSRKWGGKEVLQKGEDGSYICKNKEQILFTMHGVSARGKKKLVDLIEKRKEETEETSIKFSNLPLKELEAYRAGNPSQFLQYELSFWSDLAKWLMNLQEAGAVYELEFTGDPLPSKLNIKFPDIHFFFHIQEASLPWIIPSLKTVNSPIHVQDLQDQTIQNISYDETARSLIIEKDPSIIEDQGIPIGQWHYEKSKGFYRIQKDPFLEKDLIGEDRIALALSNSTATLQKFLPIFLEKRKCNYSLYFDREKNLHIELYVEEPNDLASEKAACFYPWVYVPTKGFYELDEWLFEEKKKIIPKSEVADFINHHRTWLHNFPGFQTHLGSLESHLTYRLTEEDDLIFEAELNFEEDYEDTSHFEEWVYIRGQGFYMKKESRSRLPIHPGLKIPKQEISEFLKSHKEELEQIPGFYTVEQPIKKMGIEMSLREDNLIELIPKIEYESGIEAAKLKRFGDYYYLKDRGFFEIPPINRLPERYSKETIIEKRQESAFLAYELEPLMRYLIKIDPRLIPPKELKLKIRKILPSRGKKGKE